MKNNKLFSALYGLLVVIILNTVLMAQMSNTDTLDKGKVYAEVNLWTGVQSHQNGGQQVYGGRFSYGLKKGLEIGVNASGSDPLDTEFPIEIQPNIKWKFHNNEKKGIEASVGAILFLPIAKREGTNTFVMTYANFSKKVKYGTRLTAGGYYLINHDKSFGSNKGVNLMVEKSFVKNTTLSLQWMSGKNRFGYLTGGISVPIKQKKSLFVGYSVGNYDYDNHGPYISFSRYF